MLHSHDYTFIYCMYDRYWLGHQFLFFEQTNEPHHEKEHVKISHTGKFQSCRSNKQMNPITRKSMSKLVIQPSFRAVGQTNKWTPSRERAWVNISHTAKFQSCRSTKQTNEPHHEKEHVFGSTFVTAHPSADLRLIRVDEVKFSHF